MIKRGSGIFSVDELLADWRLPQKPKSGSIRRRAKGKKYGETAPLTGHYLIEYAKKMTELEKVFVSVLPKDMQQEFHLARYDDGELVIFCNDANHASYLKYHSAEFMEELQGHASFEQLVKIKICRAR